MMGTTWAERKSAKDPDPSTLRYCRRTVGQHIQLLWEQTDFDFTVGQCLESGENSVC